MEVHVHIHHHFGGEVLSTLEKIMATQAQLADDLNKLNDQIKKIGAETSKTLQKVTDLEALLKAGGNTTPEVDAAMAAAKTSAQAADDLVPDQP